MAPGAHLPCPCVEPMAHVASAAGAVPPAGRGPALLASSRLRPCSAITSSTRLAESPWGEQGRGSRFCKNEQVW